MTYSLLSLLPILCWLQSTSTQNEWLFIGKNVALHKNATQFPGTDHRGDPNRAVDGNSNSNWESNSCTHTNASQQEAYWQVNLDGNFYITEVHIVNRDELTERLKKFQVIGLNGSTEEVLFDDETHSTYAKTNITIPLDLNVTYSGIRVKIPANNTGKGNATLTLCEVEIYGGICKRPPQINHTNPKAVYNEHDAIQFICDSGYMLSKQPFYKCTGTGEWNDTFPVCNIVNCTHPHNITDGFYTIPNGTYLNTSFSFNSTIYSNCNQWYALDNGVRERTCLESGNWSGQDPHCQATACKHPGNITDGRYVLDNGTNYYNGFLPLNVTITTKCTLGYNQTFGSLYRTCTTSGDWSGDDAKCSLITCTMPVLFDNGYYKTIYANTTTSLLYNSTIEAVCNTMFFLKSSLSALHRCTENGTWYGEMPLCVPLCTAPSLDHGSFKNSSSIAINERYYMSVESVQLECDEGYYLNISNSTILCQNNHTWNYVAGCHVIAKEAVAPVPEASVGSASIIGGAVGGILVVMVISLAIGIVVFRKRTSKRTPNTNHHQHSENIADHGNVFANLHEKVPDNEQDPVYNNVLSSESVTIPSTAIRIHDLSNFVFNGTDTENILTKQFESLPLGLQAAHTAASKMENRCKNKYKNMFPYDDTRVVLETESDSQSDYINASYILGINRTVDYVATQGPLKETVNDFWRMVWQLDCGKIVMLTNLTEKQTVKCHLYWPSEGTETCDNIVVTLLDTEIFCDFVIRTLSLQKKSSKKKVTQFHFTTWPDKDVPKCTSSIVHFRNKVKYADTHGKGPLIVHCSAGVGRTGVFIALDYLINQANALGYVDIIGCVRELRQLRVNLIQTLFSFHKFSKDDEMSKKWIVKIRRDNGQEFQSQYKFLHQALVESLSLTTSGVPASKFPDSYKELLVFDPDKRQRGIDVEFEMLAKLSPKTEEKQYASAKSLAYREKNRYLNILPAADYMLTLSTSEDPGGGYINAVLLPNYKESRAFIITQTPLASTKADFWNMVYEYEVHTIVMMNHITELKADEMYWPMCKDNITYDQLVISHLGLAEIKGHVVIDLMLSKFLQTRRVKLIQCGNWKDNDNTPESPDAILTVLEIVQEWQRQTENKPVVVHCMNGADKSGLFCVISAVIERLKIEQNVAITQVIQNMRSCREQIIPNVEQFQFCYETVVAYLQLFETYSNFSFV